jgi:phosphoketolase
LGCSEGVTLQNIQVLVLGADAKQPWFTVDGAEKQSHDGKAVPQAAASCTLKAIIFTSAGTVFRGQENDGNQQKQRYYFDSSRST